VIYLDTSLLAAIFFREANAVELVARIERMRQQRLMIFRTAAVLIDTPVALRAGDALHLAVIRRLNARLASLDRRLCEATDRLGIGRVELA
jgi:predicted nucleic acid-binding protein